MICPKCHTPLELPSNFCPHCGFSLQRRGGRILSVTAGIVLAILIGVYGYVNDRFHDGKDRPVVTISPEEERLPANQPNDSSGFYNRIRQSSATSLPINVGELILKDVTGERLGSYPVAIVSSGWFAFPMQLLIGAYTWQIVIVGERSVAVEGAILQDGDPVGLWEVPLDTPLGGIELMPWTPHRPLLCYSLDELGEGRAVSAAQVETLGNFDRIAPGGENKVLGVYVQDDNVVGWTFGDWVKGGYLWTGSAGLELIPEFYTDDFYRLTFEGSREEALLLSLADPEMPEIQRLAALAEAYRLEARMPPRLVPKRISPNKIHEAMRHLVEGLRNQGQSEKLLALFDPQILAAINHPPLVAELAAAAKEAGDYEEALTLVEMGLQMTPDGMDSDFDAMQSVIYHEWLQRLIAQGDEAAARAVYEEAARHFPEDPAIYLAGVEIVLQRRNWRLAERLLAGRRYPPELRGRVNLLNRNIDDLKSQEGKILIRFQPGSRTVPVSALLDGSVTQSFLIDTGASVVTIPSETVHRLGIDLTGRLPRRLFYSATGAQNAIEVTLPSIEIEGLTVADVKALVVDLPGQPGVGLLGMNYLRNFRMDLDTGQGLLTLAPR